MSKLEAIEQQLRAAFPEDELSIHVPRDVRLCIQREHILAVADFLRETRSQDDAGNRAGRLQRL